MSAPKFTPEVVTLEETQIEVGTGEPGYRWARGYYMIRNGQKLYPPMPMAEIRAIAKRDGFSLALADGGGK